MMSSMWPMACPLSSRCWTNLDLSYPYLMSRRCSWERVLNDLPVCPVCFMLHVAGGTGDLINLGFLIFTYNGGGRGGYVVIACAERFVTQCYNSVINRSAQATST